MTFVELITFAALLGQLNGEPERGGGLLPTNIPKPSLRNRWVSLAGLMAFAAGTATCAACNGLAFVSPGQITLSEQAFEVMAWGPASYILLAVGIGGGIGFLVWLAVHFGARGRLG